MTMNVHGFEEVIFVKQIAMCQASERQGEEREGERDQKDDPREDKEDKEKKRRKGAERE
jgi:hypothetical protein